MGGLPVALERTGIRKMYCGDNTGSLGKTHREG